MEYMEYKEGQALEGPGGPPVTPYRTYAIGPIVPVVSKDSLGESYGNLRRGKHRKAVMCRGQRTAGPTPIQVRVDPAERVPARTQ